MIDNFKILIGRGRFGMVYHGTLNNGFEVTVKLLFITSNQSCKEFENELYEIQLIDFILVI